MEESGIISGRNIAIAINGRSVLQAEYVEIRRFAEWKRIRSCFVSNDIAHIRKNCGYKLNMTGLRLKKPFENLNFADLDHFTLEMTVDGQRLRLEGCMWDDFLAAADKDQFREHISALAIHMTMEDAK